VKVQLYVEGGPKGAHADGLRSFRNGFKKHLIRLDSRLHTLEVSPCGSTDETIRDYAHALRENRPDCIVVLLVDSDAPVVAANPAKHLQAKLDVLDNFASAVKPTPSGAYHKIQHGAKILAELNPDLVAKRSGHARSLYSFLRNSAHA